MSHACATLLLLACEAASCVAGAATTLEVRPSATDPAIHRFNEPHYVVVPDGEPARQELLVFLPGTGGRPANVSGFIDAAAGFGYRAIALAYNDVPAVVQMCRRDPDPTCSARFREERIYGDDVSGSIDDAAAESIVNRLARLLAYLAAREPAQRWRDYLDDGGLPRWDRIVVAGHSQGAGMAAFLARRQAVARVVLFSSPWDFYGDPPRLAPWIRGPGATPPQRWFGAYHARENTARVIAAAYAALGIPPAHVRVFAREPRVKAGANPYHVSLVGNRATPLDADGRPAYLEDWRFLLTAAPQ